jgi:hypothetical protein
MRGRTVTKRLEEETINSSRHTLAHADHGMRATNPTLSGLRVEKGGRQDLLDLKAFDSERSSHDTGQPFGGSFNLFSSGSREHLGQ